MNCGIVISFVRKKLYKNIFYTVFSFRFIAFVCFYFMFMVRGKADNIVPAVPFFPERYVYLKKSDNIFHKKIQKYILSDFKTDGLKFFIGNPHNKSDYVLRLNYGLGCPNLGNSSACRLLVLWDLFRADNAPVASWQAYYPVDISVDKHVERFKNYKIPYAMIARVGDDFIKSLNYETLRKQEFDKVYIKPDMLSDKTTLCSADTISEFYEEVGLYVTQTAHKARFFVTTTITSVEEHKNGLMLHIERMILDRLTGHYEIFPIKTQIEKNFLENDSYNCQESASITLQDIGRFINDAP